MTQLDLNAYTTFVEKLTSEPSNDTDAMLNRITELQNNYPHVNIALFMNSATGIGSEGGEIEEIMKKVIWQGKELTDENLFHIKRELGDLIFYFTNMCRAIGVKPEDVIAENVNKLESRYPGGKFDVFHSEVRKEGDL